MPAANVCLNTTCRYWDEMYRNGVKASASRGFPLRGCTMGELCKQAAA